MHTKSDRRVFSNGRADGADMTGYSVARCDEQRATRRATTSFVRWLSRVVLVFLASEPRSSFYFPQSSSSPQSSSASSHSLAFFFPSAGAGLSLPLADPDPTLPAPLDPDAAD